MPKPFLTFDAQISYLESEKNLLIEDHDYARTMLKRIGYFSLIGGYKTPFKNPTTRKYEDGTRFEDIVALYDFDENLRELFLKYILKIERHIRALLSYHFTEKHGEQQCEYWDNILADYLGVSVECCGGEYMSNKNGDVQINCMIGTVDSLSEFFPFPSGRTTWGFKADGAEPSNLSKLYIRVRDWRNAQPGESYSVTITYTSWLAF